MASTTNRDSYFRVIQAISSQPGFSKPSGFLTRPTAAETPLAKVAPGHRRHDVQPPAVRLDEGQRAGGGQRKYIGRGKGERRFDEAEKPN